MIARIKRLWWIWKSFSRYRAEILCGIDQEIYGNSIMKDHWWGTEHISYPEYLRKATKEAKGEL